MNYYRVLSKCGHVGRNNYILKNLYIKANDGKEAAKKARETPRVKHNHKDAIREVEEINLKEYIKGLSIINADDYFNVHNKQEQIRMKAVKLSEVFKENTSKNYKKRRTRQNILNALINKDIKNQIKEEYYEQY